MKFAKLFPRLAVVGGLALTAAAITYALQTGVVEVKPEAPTVAYDIPVPETATTFKFTVYDHDGWYNPDDVLEKEDWEPVPTGRDGKKVTNINLQIQLACIGGSVAGGGGSSGEGTAEVYVVVEFNNGKDSYETGIIKVSCP
jgi:hypothetical protein